MEAKKMSNLKLWLKRRLNIAKESCTKQCDALVLGRRNTFQNNLSSGSSSMPGNPDSPANDRKRKLSWGDIFRPLKALRLESGERKPIAVVRGNFSLSNINDAMFPGHQTAATSLCAIIRAQSISPITWSTGLIDRLLIQEDRFHSTRVVHLGKNTTGQLYLTPEELPNNIVLSHREYSVQYQTISSVHQEKGKDSQFQNGKLAGTLKLCLRRNPAGMLLTEGKDTVAIFCDNTYCYLFNPCRKTNKLFSEHDHEACLYKFRDVDHLSLYVSQKLLKDEPYSLTAVDVSVDLDTWAELSFASQIPRV